MELHEELEALGLFDNYPDCYAEFCPDCHDTGVNRGGMDCPCYTPDNCPCEKCEEQRKTKEE